MRIATVLSVALVVVFAVGLIGCKKPAATVATVNAKCPMMSDSFDKTKVAPALVRDFAGQKVGFCCAACPDKWDKLTDAEKTAKLAAAMAPAILTE